MHIKTVARRDHGGDLDQAIALYGGQRLSGAPDSWIDLSTGINRCPWPVPPLPEHVWTALPTADLQQAFLEAASTLWQSTEPVLAIAGAQMAIQHYPRLWNSGPVGARVLSPTYNEHAAALRYSGWRVTEVSDIADLAGADLAVLVNPNNPDGLRYTPDEILKLRRSVGALVVDESFGDITPDLSVVSQAAQSDILVLRSFGKFFGLAGVRLGCVFGPGHVLDRLDAMIGPWAVSGPALWLGTRALGDQDWIKATRNRLADDAIRLDNLATLAGWQPVGGTDLFRLYDVGETASIVRDRLAHHHIWGRIFPDHPRWLRLGLPGEMAEWDRVAAALIL